MSTSRENTLQIREFGGIDRYLKSTDNEPNKFRTLENVDVVNKNELKEIDSYSSVISGLPGVDQINTVAYMRMLNGERNQTLVYTKYNSMTSSGLPRVTVPSGAFTTVDAPEVWGVDAWVQFCGVGGTTDNTKFDGTFAPDVSAIVVGAGGVAVDITAFTIPDYICHINFYFADRRTVGCAAQWCGSVTRINGVFPSSITMPLQDILFITGPTDLSATPDSFSFSASSSVQGKLEPGQTYYFGCAPWVSDDAIGGVASTCSLSDSHGGYFAYTMPPNTNTLEVTFTGVPLTIGGTAFDRCVIFCGLTPETMTPVYDASFGVPRSGISNPIRRSPFGTTGAIVYELPLQSNQGLIASDIENECPARNTQGYNYDWAPPDRFSLTAAQRAFWINQNAAARGGSYFSRSFAGCGCWVLNSLPFTTIATTNVYQVLPNWSAREYRFTGVVSRGVTTPAVPNDEVIYASQGIVDGSTGASAPPKLHWVQYGPQIFTVNGQQTPWVNNGQLMQPIMRDYQTPQPPLCTQITSFNGRIVTAGGKPNAVNQDGFIYFCETTNPNKWGFQSTDNDERLRNTLNAFDNKTFPRIVGLDVYSQNLLDLGPNAFLVIGTDSSVLVWNGQLGSGAQQMQNFVGWSSPNCYTRTKFGPMFVGTDLNLYYMTGPNEITPMGYEVQDILKPNYVPGTEFPAVVFQDNRIKVLYQDSGAVNEIWLFMEQSEGQLKKFYSGPHTLLTLEGQSYINQMTISSVTERDRRLGWVGSEVILMDEGNSYPLDAKSRIVIDRLGLGADHFWKVLDRIYLALNSAPTKTFTFTLGFQDGSSSITFTQESASTSAQQFLQKYIEPRGLGRVVSITIEWEPGSGVSLYDISLTYQGLKRRLLNYT